MPGKLIIVLILVLGLSNQARSQYFLQFISEKENRAVVDLSVHLTYLPEGKSPEYGFYLTDATGMVQVSNSGTYFLQINYAGYQTIQDTIILNVPKKPYEFRLKPLEFDLNELVVTGQYEITTTDQSVNKVKVIDSKRIERQGAVNLRDLLSNELNIRISNDNVFGSSMSLQGIGGQNVKILIDGVPMIGRLDGKLDLTQINLNNIERVEIIEGPMSVMYGTNALGGVINLITKKGTSHTLEGGGAYYTETNGTHNVNGNVALRKKKFNIQTNIGRNFSHGMSVEGESRSKTWKPREQYFGDLTTGFKIKNSLQRIQLGVFDEKLSDRGEAVIQPYQVYAFDQYYFTRRLSAGLYSDFQLGSKTTLNLTNSYSSFRRIKNTYRKDLVALEQKLSSDPEAHDTTVFDLWLFRGIYTNNKGKKFKYQLGYDINLESGGGEKIAGDRQYIYDFAGFATAEIKPFTRLSVKPGLRAAYNTKYESPLIPSLHLKYDISSRFQIRASYANGFRAPGLKELNLFFVDVSHNIRGNQDLKAEKSRNYNLSASFTGKLSKWNYKIEAASFYNHIRDMISLALVNQQTQLYSYMNISEFKTNGYNVSGEIKKEGISLTAGYALTGRSNNIEQTDGDAFSWSPEYRFNAVYTIPKIKTDLALFYKRTGATPGFSVDESGNVLNTNIEGYTTMDATLSRTFWKRRIQTTVGAKNIFDVKNVNISGSNAAGGVHSGSSASMPVNMGRTWFVSLKVNLVEFKQ